MFRICVICLLFGSFAIAAQTPQKGNDSVPDAKTAERIADAVLVAKFGEERVNAQRPLHVDGSNKDYWIVQWHESTAPVIKGGGPAVVINKHSGCLKIMEHMK